MSKKIRVLLIEDNDDERDFMREGFHESGLYEIIAEASSGDELNQIFKTSGLSSPELVISDLNMPGRNGYEVIIDIKTQSHLSHIPVVILSSAPFRPFAERCKKLGACAYFTKPETFLEYKTFAKAIYPTIVNDCIGSC
jgi:CheY-like chemotaxis protein